MDGINLALVFLLLCSLSSPHLLWAALHEEQKTVQPQKGIVHVERAAGLL